MSQVHASVLSNRNRAHYNLLSKDYEGMTITESFLRIENVISNTNTNYIFDPRTLALKDTAVRVLQKVLADNDLFVVLDIAFFIDQRTKAKQGTAVLQTYPNVSAFSAAGTVPADLEVFYNSTYSLKVANRLFIDNDTTRKFRVVPQTQQSSASNRSQSDASSDFYHAEPLAVLSGKQDAKITLVAPYFTGIAVEPTDVLYENILTLEVRGYQIINGANNFEQVLHSLGLSSGK